MKNIISIDPGKTGAISIRQLGTAEPVVYDMPDTAPGVVSLLSRLSGDVRVCMIEQQQAYPRQGLSSTFSYGVHCGVLTGAAIAAGLPIEFVTPSNWKRAMGLLNTNKSAARNKAATMFPDAMTGDGGDDPFARAKDDGRAEAVLIGVFAERQMVKVAA